MQLASTKHKGMHRAAYHQPQLWCTALRTAEESLSSAGIYKTGLFTVVL